jgi:WD40 repeat protein
MGCGPKSVDVAEVKTAAPATKDPGCAPDGSREPQYRIEFPHRLGTLTGHGQFVQKLSFNPQFKNLLISAAWDGTARLWNVDEERELWQASYPNTKLTYADFSNDGHYALISGHMPRVEKYNVHTGEKLTTYNMPDSETWGELAIFSRDDKYVIVGGTDGYVYVFEADTGNQRSVYVGHEFPIHALAYSPRRNLVLSSSGESIHAWNLETGNLVTKLVDPAVGGGRRMWAETIGFAGQLDYVVAGSNRMVVLFETMTGRVVQRFVGHSMPVTHAVISENYCQIISSAQDGFLQIWDVRSGQALSYAMGWNFIPMPAFTTAAATAPDFKSFAVSKWLFQNPTIEIWRINQREEE